MKSLRALPACTLLACASSPDAPHLADTRSWLASVVDMPPAGVHALLGAPTSRQDDGRGISEECFEATPPWTRRCVSYLDGRVIADAARLEVAPEAMSRTFDAAVREVSATLGRGPAEVQRFGFTAGAHVLGDWGGRGFRFGESCVFESAWLEARVAHPEGLAPDAVALADALRSGTGCLHALWGPDVSLRTGEGDAPNTYGVGLSRLTTDPAQRARMAALEDASRSQIDAALEKLRARLEAEGLELKPPPERQDTAPRDGGP
jgi:hypothetical protein